ncbi:MAG: L-threonylcarbamoyladenylate synthase [Candidatus Nanohaloarchaea archaeon]|nr:L-threonylcarbamoyladenylate synthase [Candidatus Nanohaloarchaea archaeon]
MKDGELERAVEVLENAGLVIYPTETCYGIGCDALDEEAVKEVYKAKERPREKKLTVIVSDLKMAERYCNLSDIERKVCNEFMPGSLTVLADKKSSVPDILNDRFAFRVPANSFCRELSGGLDRPVVATSANISGARSSYSVDEIDKKLRERADLVVDHGRLEKRPSSTIIDIGEEGLKVYREGPIKEEEIRGVIDGG